MTDIVKSTIADLKGIPTEEALLAMLRESMLVVTFDKLDGEERIMTCTKALSIIPEANHPKTDKPPKEGTITVWDVNANGWRSFRYDRVKKVDIFA